MSQLETSEVNSKLVNIGLNVTTKDVSKYNDIDKFARRFIEELDGLNIEVMEVSVRDLDGALSLTVTAPGSINHNTWQKLQNRFRTYDDIEGLYFNVLEVSIRNKNINGDIKIRLPKKTYSAKLRLIKGYDSKIAIVRTYDIKLKH